MEGGGRVEGKGWIGTCKGQLAATITPPTFSITPPTFSATAAFYWGVRSKTASSQLMVFR